jgi:hypothetical protein
MEPRFAFQREREGGGWAVSYLINCSRVSEHYNWINKQQEKKNIKHMTLCVPRNREINRIIVSEFTTLQLCIIYFINNVNKSHGKCTHTVTTNHIVGG